MANLAAIDALPAHSKLGASSYHRWGKSLGGCPGSIRECQDKPKYESEYAREGTEAHELAALILTGKGDQILPGITPGDMIESIQVYVDFINALRQRKPDFEAVEQKFHLEKYHPDLFGTADYVCYFEDAATVHVVDYKHGAGVPVEVEMNHQLLYYAVGALHANKFSIEKIKITIVQPRCFHKDGAIRTWETDTITVLDFIADLIDDAKETERPGAALIPGDHCRWCPAQPTCPALQEKALATAREIFKPTETYDPEKLSKTLQALPQIEAWCKSVREFAYREAEQGRVPPGYKLVDKRASRKWPENFKPSDICFKVGLDEQDFYDQKIKSIPQIEKIIKKEYKPILESVTVKESSGRNLVAIEDDRGAIDALEVAFSKIEN